METRNGKAAAGTAAQVKAQAETKTLSDIIAEVAPIVKLSFTEKMEQAKAAYAEYRQAGGTEIGLDWLWDHDRDLFGEMQSRWRFQSSYTAIAGGVMFCPKPMRR